MWTYRTPIAYPVTQTSTNEIYNHACAKVADSVTSPALRLTIDDRLINTLIFAVASAPAEYAHDIGNVLIANDIARKIHSTKNIVICYSTLALMSLYTESLDSSSISNLLSPLKPTPFRLNMFLWNKKLHLLRMFSFHPSITYQGRVYHKYLQIAQVLSCVQRSTIWAMEQR